MEHFFSKYFSSHCTGQECAVQNLTDVLYQVLTQNLSGDCDLEILLWGAAQQQPEPPTSCWDATAHICQGASGVVSPGMGSISSGWLTRPLSSGEQLGKGRRDTQFFLCYTLWEIRNKSSAASDWWGCCPFLSPEMGTMLLSGCCTCTSTSAQLSHRSWHFHPMCGPQVETTTKSTSM